MDSERGYCVTIRSNADMWGNSTEYVVMLWKYNSILASWHYRILFLHGLAKFLARRKAKKVSERYSCPVLDSVD